MAVSKDGIAFAPQAAQFSGSFGIGTPPTEDGNRNGTEDA